VKTTTPYIRLTTLAAAVHTALAMAPAAAEQLDEIVVTARKTEERLQDVPLSVTAFSTETLQDSNARDVFDLTRLTPGFSFERLNRYGVQGGVSRPVIRGMSNILGEGNASVFVDGILFSDSILSFPFDIVDRVEVIKGPQAALFGRATFAGAINLVTKKGTNEPENAVSLRGAEFADYEANFLSRGAISEDRLFYMVHGRYYTFDGMYRNSMDGGRIGDEESRNFNTSLEYRGGETFSAIFNAGYSEDDDGHAAIALQDRFANNCHLDAPRQYFCGEVGEQSNATLDLVGLAGTAGVDRDSTRLSMQLQWDLDGFSIVSNTGAFFTDSAYGYDSTYQAATAIAPTTVPGAPGSVRAATDPVRTGSVMRLEVTERDEWSTELRVQSAGERRLSWLGGVFFYKNKRTLEEQHFAATAPPLFNGESRVDNWAVFGSVGFDVTDRWNVTAELRRAEETIGNFKSVPTEVLIEQDFESWSPRVTTSFDITPAHMVYANVARGNKPGVINADPRFPPEILFADEEKAWSYEIGSKNELLDGRMTLNAAAYYIDWTNQQLTTAFTFPGGGTQSYITNAGKSEVKGFELELLSAITDSFTAGLTYAFTDATFVELNDPEAQQLFGDPSLKGRKLPAVPEQQGSIYGRYERNVGAGFRGYTRADLSYTDKKYDQVFNLAHTGDQALVNLTLGLTNDRWNWQLFVRNLTDDRTPSSVTRYVDQLNLNVPQYANANPAQNNVAGSTTLERAFFYPLAMKRQIGINASYQF
jgi:iron complex outermembrane recepter protein